MEHMKQNYLLFPDQNNILSDCNELLLCLLKLTDIVCVFAELNIRKVLICTFYLNCYPFFKPSVDSTN